MHDAADIPGEWLAEFEAAARRPLRQRFRYAFVRTYKPVLDDARFRSFESMEAYRKWCEANLPDWLGYGRLGKGGRLNPELDVVGCRGSTKAE